MVSRTPPIGREGGFTLIEVMAAMLILLIGVLGTVALIDQANFATRETKFREGGTSLAREVAEAARAVQYSDLDNAATATAALQARVGLEDDSAAAAGWQINRRDTTYTLAMTVCTFDDGKDGFGVHTGAGFCAGAAGTSDTVPDDYKRVTVDITWTTRGNKTQRASQTTLVNNPGNSFGPAIASLSSDLGLLVHDPNELIYGFDAVTSRAAARVEWSLDGVKQGNASPQAGDTTGKLWEFAWVHPANGSGQSTIVDGTYLVGAQAFNADGLSGGTRSIQVVLDRYVPTPPTLLVVGRAGLDTGGDSSHDRVVDLSWKANPEKDIVGYEAYRQVGTLDSPVGSGDDVKLNDPNICALDTASATQCTDDFAAPSGTVYYVVSIDTDTATAGNPRRRSSPTALTFSDAATRPGPVVALCKTVDGVTADVTLRWQRPTSPPVASPTDTIAGYRIYRGGDRVPADRLVLIGTPVDPSSQVAFTHAAAGDSQYFVAAVDNLNNESSLSEAAVCTP